MTFKGIVKKGVIVLTDGVKLPDGVEVQVEVPDEFLPADFWDDEEWERRAKGIRAMTGIGRSSGGHIGRYKHEHLAEIYGSERTNVSHHADEKGFV